jgi:UDP:flavonoid glycosyltransferase YjiC (YdhE family)
VVVCPGFGDQQSNASKVVARGWGEKVDRPVDSESQASYEAMVRSSVRTVLAGEDYTRQAQYIAAGLEKAEGVDGALRILKETAGS